MKTHSFHIPVMGIGFTIDTPLKVSQYGIDSVISLVDDILIERLRKMYYGKNEIEYIEIDEKTDDFRAKRITSYLNLMQSMAIEKFTEFKDSVVKKGDEVKKYLEMLPSGSSLKKELTELTTNNFNLAEIKEWFEKNLTLGSIDVNVMTKVDKEHYRDNEKLPDEYNDAHAAIRGFANSNLNSAVILSAGMNPRLFGYMENFADFYPNENGEIKKRIILKVSDYRSAMIQGKFLAKKGLWISEFRIESGLNCGGHAFATEGSLMGPILAEFRDQRNVLKESLYELFRQSLLNKQKAIPNIENLQLQISAQGGVGTAEEHEFLLAHYNVDSVGWGTPFLLVPEVVNVDEKTLSKLIDAKEEDLYLSGISPLGIPFNSLKGNTKDAEKLSFIEKGRPGSACPKKFVEFNKEFVDKGICTSSRQYQHLKLKELELEGLEAEEYNKRYEKIVEKSCTCVGLGTAALLVNNLDTKVEGEGVSICPGPNMAYFSKQMTLTEIIKHIYGQENFMTREDRPNMFIKELNIYIDYFFEQIQEATQEMNKRKEKYLSSFSENMQNGIAYYQDMFSKTKGAFADNNTRILDELEKSKTALLALDAQLKNLSVTA